MASSASNVSGVDRRARETRDAAGRSKPVQREQIVPVLRPWGRSPEPDAEGSGAGSRTERRRETERRTIETRETLISRTKSPVKEDLMERASRKERERVGSRTEEKNRGKTREESGETQSYFTSY
jgi:hypothetical protein